MRAHKNIVWSVALTTLLIGVCFPARADAQWRRYRPARTHVVIGGYYGYPYGFYDPWYGFGYPYAFGPYPPFPYRYYGYGPGAALRLEVKPKEAEVYVDGYYAGVVDDFDGVFQRLEVEPGEHEIALYLDGYRTVKQRLYVTPRHTFKVRLTMERLGAGEQQEPRPEPVNPPPAQAGAQPPTQGTLPGRGPAGRRMPPPPAPPRPGAPPGEQRQQRPEASAYGTLAIRVQPADVEVLIDGQTWRGPATQEGLLIDVAEGAHTIQIQKAGYRTYVTEVQIRPGDTTTLNVSLRNQN